MTIRIRIRIALLLMLIGAAAFTGAEALRSLRRAPGEAFPEEIYARFARSAESASYVLRADRAMIRQGLPVRTRPELLQLLEDLGS